MPDTEQFIFETDINANVNTEKAESALDRLKARAKEAAGRISESFAHLDESIGPGIDRLGEAFVNVQAPAAQLGQIMETVGQHAHNMAEMTKVALSGLTNDFKRLGEDIKTNWRSVPAYVFGSLKDDKMRMELQDAIQKQMAYLGMALQTEDKAVRAAYKTLAEGMFLEIDAIRARMGQAGRDIGLELASGLDMARDAIQNNSLGIAYDLAQTNSQMANNMRELSKDIQSSIATINYAMRQLTPTASESIGEIGRALKLLRSDNVRTGESFDFLVGSVGDFGRSIGLLSEESVQFLGKIGNFSSKVSQFFERVKAGGATTDKAMLAVSDSIEELGQHLKIQQGVLSRVFQDSEVQVKAQVAEYKNWLAAMQKVYYEIGYVSKEQEKSKLLTKEQREELKKLGIEGVAEYDKFKAKLMEVAQETTRLTNLGKSMGEAWRRHFSALGALFFRLETGAYHFGTTLEASGRVSVDRIKDLRVTMEHVNKVMQDMRNIGVQNIPELGDLFNLFGKSVKQAGREVRELGLHEQRLRESTGNLNASFLQVEKGTGGFLSGLKRLVPFIGKTKKDVDDLSKSTQESYRGMGGGAESVVQQLSYSLGGLDPVFMEVTQGARMMGYGLGNVMTEMDATVATKAAGVVKSLGLIKLAAAGIIGVFGGLIISTGKLAANVTTLEMTMTTVAKNLGYSKYEVEAWRDGIKEMGITTRAATNAVTQFLRAKLPTSWYDPIQEATFSMEDLARAAQNLAVSVGEDSSETFNRFIYFIQSGNSQLLDTIGIAKNASVMLDEYAKAVGKTTKQLSQREYYEALISGLMREGAQIQGVYEEAMKTANKQLGSMVRYLEELRYEWGKYFEPIMTVAIKKFNEFLKILTNVPEKTKKTITTLVTILTGISGLILGIGVLLPKLKLLFKFMGAGLGSLLSPVGLLITALTFLGPRLLEAFTGFKLGKEGIEGMSEKASGLADSLFSIGDKLKPIMDWVKNFAEMIGTHIKTISDKVIKLVDKIKDKIDEFVLTHPKIMEFLERAKTVFGDLFTIIWRVVDKVLSAIESLLDQDYEGFMENLRAATRLIASWVMEFFNEIVKSAFEWGRNIISAFVSGIVDKARTAIPRAMSTVGMMIASFLQGHSPAKIGPLSTIDRWGVGLMSAFERGLRQKRILFDEGMFLGMATLNAKAKVWGDNITTTFASGIVGKAASAIIPAMDYVGSMIALFLEGHSPPITGKLVEIEDWGRNAFETFLSGFQMADFTILDRALDLVGQRLSTLIEDSKKSAAQIAGAMMQIREAVAGAIFQARTTGGPLDLSGIQNIISGSIRVFAGDIADVLEANFAAIQAQAAFQRLQGQIEAARAARARAIQAAQRQLQNLQDNIKDKQKEIEELGKQMAEEFETRAKAAGIWVDPKLMAQLQRDMERASIEVQRAQNRLRRVREASSRYGINLLTWEEINAQAQLEFAEQRQQEVQEQIWTQEELQRKAEELQSQIQDEYEMRFKALEDELKALQERAEAAQENLQALQRANADATAAENEQLAAARAHADELAAHAELLNKLLDERMKAEKDLAAIIADQTGKTEEDAKELERIGARPGMHGRVAKRRIPERPIEPPEASPLWVIASRRIDEILGAVGLSLENGLGGLLVGIKTKIGEYIDQKTNEVTTWFFTQTSLGKFITAAKSHSGIIGYYYTILEGFADHVKIFTDGLGNAWDSIKDFVGFILGEWWAEMGEIFDKFSTFGEDLKTGWAPVIEWFHVTFGPLAELMGGFLDIIFEFSKIGTGTLVEFLGKILEVILEFGKVGFDLVIEVLSELIQIFIDLVTLDFEGLSGDLGEIGDAFGRFWQAVKDIFSGKSLEPIKEWWADLTKRTEESVKFLIYKIEEWVKKLPAIISKPFEMIWKFLVYGNSEKIDEVIDLFKDMWDDFKKFFTDLPRKVKEWWADLKKAVIGIWEDIKDELIGHSIIPDIIDGIVDFFLDLPGKLLGIAGDLWDAAVELGAQILDGISSKIDEIDIGAWLSEKASSISNAATSFFNKAVELGGSIISGLTEKIGEIGTNIATWLSTQAANITGAAQTYLDNAKALGGNIVAGISQRITEIGDSIAGWLSTAAGNIQAAAYNFFQNARIVAGNIYNGIRDVILGENGIIGKIGDWLKTVADWIINEGSGVLNWFIARASSVGAAIMSGISSGIQSLIDFVVGGVKSVWNNGLKGAFQGVLDKIIDAINGVIGAINDWWRRLGSPPISFMPISPVGRIILPSLDVGGIVTGNTVAQLHAGEIVMPLDRLASIMRNANMNPVPAFAPTLNFYPGSSPQQVMPAIHQAYDWYIEEQRRP